MNVITKTCFLSGYPGTAPKEVPDFDFPEYSDNDSVSSDNFEKLYENVDPCDEIEEYLDQPIIISMPGHPGKTVRWPGVPGLGMKNADSRDFGLWLESADEHPKHKDLTDTQHENSDNWYVRRGLTGEGISLESARTPNCFISLSGKGPASVLMRVENSPKWRQNSYNSRICTFTVEEGFAGEGFSLRPISNSKIALTVENNKICGQSLSDLGKTQGETAQFLTKHEAIEQESEHECYSSCGESEISDSSEDDTPDDIDLWNSYLGNTIQILSSKHDGHIMRREKKMFLKFSLFFWIVTKI